MFIMPIRHHFRCSSSLIQVFASFLYLFSSRLLIASTVLLIPVRVYHYQLRSDGNMQLITKYCLYTDPTLQYCGTGHLFYALLAVVMLVLFYVLPVILLFLYPFSWFQRSGCANSLVLKTFVDVFQGYYKDGTGGTRDYRYFSGLLLLFQLVPYLVLTLTQSSFFYITLSFFTHLYLCIILIFRPYKQYRHNLVMSLMLSVIIVMFWSMIMLNWNRVFADFVIFPILLLTVSVCLLFLCFVVLICIQVKLVLF